ncbi:MAG: hypothetical protein SGPRY_009363 [Prymnesium sp.]
MRCTLLSSLLLCTAALRLPLPPSQQAASRVTYPRLMADEKPSEPSEPPPPPKAAPKRPDSLMPSDFLGVIDTNTQEGALVASVIVAVGFGVLVEFVKFIDRESEPLRTHPRMIHIASVVTTFTSVPGPSCCVQLRRPARLSSARSGARVIKELSEKAHLQCASASCHKGCFDIESPRQLRMHYLGDVRSMRFWAREHAEGESSIDTKCKD